MALCQGRGQVGWWRQVKPGTNERWHFLKTVSTRQKSIVSTERFLCAGVLFSGVLLCFSFLPALMSPCFSSILIWCKCVERPPEPCPGWGTGTAQDMWEKGSLLSFASSAGSCSSEWTAADISKVFFLGQRFCSPSPYSQAGWWVGAAGFQPVLGAHGGWGTKGSQVRSCPHITLTLGTGPGVPAAPPHPFCSSNTSWRQQLFCSFSLSSMEAECAPVEFVMVLCLPQLLSLMDNLAGCAAMQCQLSKLQGALG